jgi:hypothetical protein
MQGARKQQQGTLRCYVHTMMNFHTCDQLNTKFTSYMTRSPAVKKAMQQNTVQPCSRRKPSLYVFTFNGTYFLLPCIVVMVYSRLRSI